MVVVFKTIYLRFRLSMGGRGDNVALKKCTFKPLMRDFRPNKFRIKQDFFCVEL